MNLLKAASLVVAVALIGTACSDSDGGEPEVVVSIVEVPGEPVTSIITEITIVEVTTSTTLDPRADWPGTLVFGIVAEAVTDDLARVLNAFAAAMSNALDMRVVGRVNPTGADLAADIDEGRADIGPLTPGEYVAASDTAEDLELLAQQVRFGDGTYHSQWFTNDPDVCGADPVQGAFHYDDETGETVPVGPTDSPALQVGWTPDGSPDDAVAAGLACPAPVDLSVVTGKTIVFTSESSSVGFIFPTAQLRQAGITNEQYVSTFAGGHPDAIEAVYNGSADIGVSFDDARRTIQETNPDVGSKVIVFNITPPIANDVLVIRQDLPSSLKDAVFTALRQYLGTDEGQFVVSELFGWNDLVRADARTTQSLDTVAAAAKELGASD